MARVSVPRNYYTFVGGKVSDSNPINPTPNTARELTNVDLEANGKISRRLGLDFEESFVLSAGPFSLADLRGLTVNTFEWFNVANSDLATFFALRIGDTMFFYDEGDLPFSGGLVASLDISTFSTDVFKSPNSPIQAASGRGVLFVTGEFFNPFFIEFDPLTATFSGTEIEMKRRDFEGVDDGLANDTRPSTLSSNHHYNLLNQGWTEAHINTFFSSQGVYPSNADIESLGFKVNSDGDREWSASEVVNQSLGNTQASKGHFVLGVFEEDRIEASGVFGLPAGGTTFRPKAVGFYAGRVWYASLKGEVFFSRILEGLDNVGDCFQDQDPTAEDFNELLDTDGGVLRILDLGAASKLLPAGQGIAIFASEGIWQVSGGESGFTANVTLLDNLSRVKVNSAGSVVRAESIIYFWSEEGIFQLVPDKISGQLVVESLSANRIQKDYNEIPAISKTLVQGTYDRFDKRIFWSYHDGQVSAADNIEPKHNSILVFDVTLNAFWDYRISDLNPSITPDPIFFSSTVKRSSANSAEQTDSVVVGLDTIDVNGVPVVVTTTFTGVNNSTLKTVCFVPDEFGVYNVTFGEFTSRKFTDWFSYNNLGESYTSVVETNPELLGEGSVEKQATYLVSFYDFKRNGYGEVLNDPRFDPTEGFRVSQALIEVLRKGLPKSRITQNAIEVLRSGTPKSRVTQNLVEVLRELS